MKAIAALWQAPISDEKRDLLDARWQELPEALRVPWQVVGKHHVHCGYTLGPSYCSFGCTHCYLPSNANKVPLPSLQEMREQIDANRRLIGPGGGLQITGGDVVDAYWRADRAGELITIIRYANDADVVPMLMTHGQLLLENPSYLGRLVREGGLRKLAIHIDITQAGRHGYPIGSLGSEEDLHPLRDSFVELIHQVRRETGVTFHAAMTVTVTEKNLSSVAKILDWLLADPRRLDAFRMISFQPEAAVGRTRSSQHPITPEETWREICAGVGLELPQDNLWFGHPDCSHSTTLIALYPSREKGAKPRVVDLVGEDAASREFWPVLLDQCGGIGSRGDKPWHDNLRRVGLAVRNPSILWKIVRYARAVMRREGIGWGALLRTLTRGRIGVLGVVQHNFMNEEDLSQPLEQVVEDRLAACCFKGATCRGDEWVAVPMCAMNIDERQDLYAARIQSAK